MTKECPAGGDCKPVADIEKTLYGADGRGGIVGDMNKKACKSDLAGYIKKPPYWLANTLVGLLIMVTLSTVGTGYKLIFGQEIAPHLYAQKDKVSDHETRIKVLEEVVPRIDKNTQDIKAQVKETNRKVEEQAKDVQKKFNEIKSLIRNLRQNHNP